MRWVALNVLSLCCVAASGLVLAAAVHPLAAAIQEERFETTGKAYATSLAFDLRPKVERATLHLRRPGVRALYQAIADAYGIRLLFDRELAETNIVSNFDLQDATLRETLDAAATISKTFVAPLDEQTGMVAADTVQKRGEYERQMLGSFQADDQTTPQQLTEITTALRTLLDLRRVTQDTRFNWITIRGITRQVTVADRFFRTLERPRPEVLLEVEIWEISSRRAREIGLQPPPQFLLQFIGRSVGALDPSLFTLGGGRTFYGIKLPSAAGQLTFSSSAVRSHQMLHLRATQDQPASLLLGQRFPIVTASLSSGFAQTGQPSVAALGFYPQIQYQDVGVTVKATPHLHAGRELTLQLDLAVRDLGSQNAVGIPTIINRQVTGQIRLKEGESYAIGGILTRSEQNSKSGYPFLSRLPLIGAVFAAFRKQSEETELWIYLRPHILRAAPAEDFASRPILFGREIAGVTPPPVEAIPAPQPLPPGVFPPGVLPPGVQPQPPGVIPQPGVPPGFAPPGTQPQPVPPQSVMPPGLIRPPSVVVQPQEQQELPQ